MFKKVLSTKHDDAKDKDLRIISESIGALEIVIENWKTYERYYESLHTEEFREKSKRLRRHNIFVPMTRNTVDIVTTIFSTAFFSDGCPIEILPKNANDPADVKEAQVKTMIVQHFWEKRSPRKELVKAMKSSLIYQIGQVELYWDGDRDEPVTNHIANGKLFYDKSCNNINDVQHVVYEHKKSSKEIERLIETKFFNAPGAREGHEECRDTYKRHKIKEIFEYSFKTKKWEVRTYLKRHLMRIATFERLPFKFGYALDRLPSVDDEIRSDDLLCLGESLVRLLIPMQDELNFYRNAKMDIQELNIAPRYMGNESVLVNPDDLSGGAGTFVRVKGDMNAIRHIPNPNESGLNNDTQMVYKDFQDASGVNGIQFGSTGASDRRSGKAMAVINQTSSTRLEDMIALIKETLFDHYAKDYVRLCIKHASDDLINTLTNETQPIGAKGRRDETFHIKINFGATINKDQKIQTLSTLFQFMASNPNADQAKLQNIADQIITLEMGEGSTLNKRNMELDAKPDAAMQEKLAILGGAL